VDDRRARICLIVLLLAGAAVRLGWDFSRPAQLDERLGDQFEYLQLGRNLLGDHELKFFDSRFGQTVYAYRTPGYPLFVAVCGGKVRAIQVGQALLDLSTGLAIYLLARGIFSRGGSLIAAGFVIFNPFLIYFGALVLSESLFTAMLAWGMYLLLTRRRIWGLVVLALSVLVRPSAIGLVVVLAVGEAWPRGWGAVFKSAGMAVAMVVLALLPWAWRNGHHPGVRAWIWTTTNGGITLYDGFNDLANGGSDQGPFLSELKRLLSRMDEVERDAVFAQQAHLWIRTHPARAIELTVIKIGRTWSPVPLSNEYGGKRLYVVIGLLFSIPFDICVVVGLWQVAIPRSVKVFLLLPAIYFTGIHALSVGSLRYRLPVEPPMALIAGSWAMFALGRLNGPSRRKS
jgi:4-amino-4-deoxy-L-arabinose transferase-like glycosyltransferase